MINDNERKNDDCFCYDVDEAAQVVWNSISQSLKERYSLEEIHFILEAEFDYLDSIGMTLDEDEKFPICNYPIDIDESKMEKYIVDAAIKSNILLNYDHLGEILEAELIYFDMHSALGDLAEYLN